MTKKNRLTFALICEIATACGTTKKALYQQLKCRWLCGVGLSLLAEEQKDDFIEMIMLLKYKVLEQ